jgi:hypothetical protein
VCVCVCVLSDHAHHICSYIYLIIFLHNNNRHGRSLFEDLVDKYRRKIEDSDDVMILREILRPRLITDAIGLWILLNDREDEGLVEDVDVTKNTLIVLFGDVDDSEEYEISFRSSDIVMWYKMSSVEEQEIEERAARTIQRAIRFKLAKKFYFNRPVSKRQISNSSILSGKKGKYDLSDNNFRQCVKPKLSSTKGYYVESPTVPNRKGLVEMVDLQQALIRVVYDADNFLLEKVFNYSDTLTWYRKCSFEKSDSLEDIETTSCNDPAAVSRLQSNYRGRYVFQHQCLLCFDCAI